VLCLKSPLYQAIHVRYPPNNQANSIVRRLPFHKQSSCQPPQIFFCVSPIRKLHAMCKSHCPATQIDSSPLNSTLSFNGATAIVRIGILGERERMVYFDESNVRSLLSEALTADVQAILADQTSLVGADTALSQLSASAPISSQTFISNSSSRNWYSERTRHELPCRTFLGASSRRIRETCWVDLVLYLQLEIRMCIRDEIEKSY
jgi:hypothetical protein